MERKENYCIPELAKLHSLISILMGDDGKCLSFVCVRVIGEGDPQAARAAMDLYVNGEK